MGTGRNFKPLAGVRVHGFEMVRASGNAPELGTHLVRWAECRGLAPTPEGTHSLAPRPGSLVRMTFQSTGTVECLSFVHPHLVAVAVCGGQQMADSVFETGALLLCQPSEMVRVTGIA